MRSTTDNEKRRARWLEGKLNDYRITTQEEKRKGEILGMLACLVELSRRRVEAPRFPPWEPPW